MATTLKNPDLTHKIQQLCETDNYTNFLHLLGIYLFLAVGIGATLWFFHYQAQNNLSFWWNIPVTFFAILWVGAGQHRLGGLAHDALHHLMFKNRYLNEIVSDWFCMFPIYSLTYFFRLEHLGHHHRVNDLEKDPDILLLKEGGYYFEGPMEKKQILRAALKLLNIPRLVRYMAIRSKYASLFYSKHAFRDKKAKAKGIYIYNSMVLIHLVGISILMTFLVWLSNPFLLTAIPLAFWLIFLGFYLFLPGEFYQQSHFHPVIPLKTLSIMRMSYVTATFWGLGLLSYWTHQWVILYYFLLWVVPMFTSFSFLTLLQQAMQHVNSDRGWLTNSRIFLMNPFIEFCIFPFGLGYHQPHHMFPSVPHYNLRKLHEMLMEYPEYRENTTVVEGYLFPPLGRPKKYPTAVEGLELKLEPQNNADVYIDRSVLENDRVDALIMS